MLYYFLALSTPLITSLVSASSCARVSFLVETSADNSAFPSLNHNTTPEQIVEVANSVLRGNSSAMSPGISPIQGSFNVSAIYCAPTQQFPRSKDKDVLQVLVHGMTYNANMWGGLGYSNHYSWMSYFARRGYATLAIDRLGHGHSSSHPDPVSTVQFDLEVRIIHQVFSQLRRSGAWTGLDCAFNKLVYVGHSYGSLLGNAMARLYPEDADAIILTGYSAKVPRFVPVIYNNLKPASQTSSRYGAFEAGYLRATNLTGRIDAFYGPPNTYDLSLAIHDFLTADTVTLGEVLTQAGGFQPTQYSGPVFVVTGANDVNFCSESFGTCDATLQATRMFFPNASSFDYQVMKNSAHCLTLNYEAPKTFQRVLDWLEDRNWHN